MNNPALDRLWDALPEARIVGGAVRDALAHRPVADIDLATPLPPEVVMKALHAAGIKVIPTGLAHGTVTAVVDGIGIEITTLRRDVETDGRHAVVAFTADWQQDAARRDFTINAMSMTRDGRVFDYFGGIADLAAGRVRFVGDPATRIAEDYLRFCGSSGSMRGLAWWRPMRRRSRRCRTGFRVLHGCRSSGFGMNCGASWPRRIRRRPWR